MRILQISELVEPKDVEYFAHTCYPGFCVVDNCHSNPASYVLVYQPKKVENG
jgi:hypothetical protein